MPGTGQTAITLEGKAMMYTPETQKPKTEYAPQTCSVANGRAMPQKALQGEERKDTRYCRTMAKPQQKARTMPA